MLHFPIISICFHFSHHNKIFNAFFLLFKKKKKTPTTEYFYFLLYYASSDFLHVAYCIFTSACYAATVLTLESYFLEAFQITEDNTL